MTTLGCECANTGCWRAPSKWRLLCFIARPERFELPTLWFEGVGGNSKSCLCRRVRAAALLHALQLCSKKSKEFLGFHSRQIPPPAATASFLESEGCESLCDHCRKPSGDRPSHDLGQSC